MLYQCYPLFQPIFTFSLFAFIMCCNIRYIDSSSLNPFCWEYLLRYSVTMTYCSNGSYLVYLVVINYQ